jgi:Flp pilus assembly protein TadD
MRMRDYKFARRNELAESIRPVIFTLVLVFLPAVWAQTGDDPVPSISAALHAQQFEQALRLLQPALERSSRDPRLWSLKGVALSGEGRKKEALVAFQQALRLAPNFLQALEGAVQIEYDAGGDAAIPLLRRILELRPNDATAHAMLAFVEYQRGHCESAITHFEKAGNLLDSQKDALHAYSSCLIKLNRFNEAASILGRSLALNPGDPHERRLLASIQLMAHKPQDALASLEPLLAVQSADAETLELVSSAYEDVGNTPKAVSTLRQAIILDPREVDLYLDFADLAFIHQSFQVGIDVLTSYAWVEDPPI